MSAAWSGYSLQGRAPDGIPLLGGRLAYRAVPDLGAGDLRQLQSLL
jgi:hypothetical protein